MLLNAADNSSLVSAALCMDLKMTSVKERDSQTLEGMFDLAQKGLG